MALENRIQPSGTWTALTNQPSEPVAPQYVAGLGTEELLPNGVVMVEGGGLNPSDSMLAERMTNQWFQLTPDASGNYADGTFSAAGAMNFSRLYDGSEILPNGKLLVLGGEDSNAGAFTNTGEILNPATDAWSPITNFPLPNFGDDPTALIAPNSQHPDGAILAGNIGTNANIDYGPNGTTGAETYLYDLSTGTWSQTGSKVREDRSDEEGWVTLPGGGVINYDIFTSISDNTFEAERYIPAGDPLANGAASTGQWVDASPPAGTIPILSNNNVGDEMGAALLLPPTQQYPEGRVFEIGANGNTAVYDPTVFFNTTTNSYDYGTWSAGHTLPTAVVNGQTVQLVAADAPAAELPDGNVLLALSPIGNTATGAYSFPSHTYLYEFNPTTNTYVQEIGDPGSAGYTGGVSPLLNALLGVPSYDTRMLVTPNGHVLLSINNSTQIWDYTPDNTQGSPPPDVPTISSVTYNNATANYTLAGTYLTGASEGAAYGDDAEMSTNFPIIKIADANGNVWYASSTNWTPGVADGASRTVQFTLPPNIPQLPGDQQFTLTVVASGVSSALDVFIPADQTAPSTGGPIYADSSWAGFSNGTSVDADPVAAGNQPGTIGVNAFATVDAAIAAAEAAEAANSGVPVAVVVNGANGGSTSGVFHEAVAVNSQVELYLQNGSVTFDSLLSDPNDTAASAEGIILHGANLTVGDGNNREYDGLITGTDSFIKTGTGTLTLGGNDYAAGGTTVNAGVLLVNGSISGPSGVTVNGGQVEVGSANALAGSTVSVNDFHGLNVNNLSATLGGLAGSSAGVIDLGLSSSLTLTFGGNNADNAYAGTFADAGSLDKVGLGTWTPSGDDSAYDGGLSIDGGFVVPGSLNALAGSTVTVNTPGELYSTIAAANMGGLAGAGFVDSVSTAFAIGGNNASTTYSGPLVNGGSVTKAGTGTLTFTGTYYTGGSGASLAITAGTLQLGNGGTAGAVQGNIVDNAALVFDQSDAVSFPGVISGSGTVSQSGNGTLILTGADTYTGTTTVSAGTLEVDGSLGATTAPAGTVTVASAGTLHGTGTINAPVVVNGTLEAGTASATGILTINGTMILYGTLDVRINGPTAGTGYDQVNVNGNVTLYNSPNSIGPTLDVTVGYSPAEGAQFGIIDVGSAYNPVQGTFGSAIINFTISYAGGSTNKDVVLSWIGFFDGGGGGGD